MSVNTSKQGAASEYFSGYASDHLSDEVSIHVKVSECALKVVRTFSPESNFE